LIIGITGLLLGWKKQTGLVPQTLKSTLNDTSPWISTDSLMQIVNKHLSDSNRPDCKVDRLDYRVQKGVIKVIFSGCFLEVQLDGKTGEILSEKQRYSDIIERIHDGSILDYFLDDRNQFFKLLYTSWLSISLIILSVSGFFLWYNPGLIRKRKKSLS
jgi:hypothetical protein